MSFRLDRFLTIYLFGPLIVKRQLADNKRISILMYHSISDDSEHGVHPYYKINTAPAIFADHMSFLSENNYSVVDLKSLKDCFEKNHELNKKFVVITFDDGYQDFYANAFPILQKYRFPATIFLPTDFIDKNQKTFNGKKCLSWSEVRELHDNGISFGSHTLSHPELYRLPWEDIRHELRDSKRCIEDRLHIPVTSFCYPYAFPQEDHNFVLRLKQEMIDQGYLLAVTTVIGQVGQNSDMLTLPRLPVNKADDEKLFEAKLSGSYKWMAVAQALVRRTKFLLRRKGADI